MRRWRSGFTLLETLLTVALCALLLGAMLPMLVGKRWGGPKQEVKRIAAILRYAHAEAMTRGAPQRALLNAQAGRLELQGEPDLFVQMPEGATLTLSRIATTEERSGNDWIDFTPDGRCDRATLTLHFQDGREEHLALDPFGRVGEVGSGN